MTNKHGAIRVVTDGITFDSHLERDVYLELVRLHDRGIIRGFVHQYRYLLRSRNGPVVGTYVADFRCLLANSAVVVVEAKGHETDLWKRNQHHFTADYPQVKLVVIKDIKSQLPLELTYQVFASAAAVAVKALV